MVFRRREQQIERVRGWVDPSVSTMQRPRRALNAWLSGEQWPRQCDCYYQVIVWGCNDESVDLPPKFNPSWTLPRIRHWNKNLNADLSKVQYLTISPFPWFFSALISCFFLFLWQKSNNWLHFQVHWGASFFASELWASEVILLHSSFAAIGKYFLRY
jgi:hypothetical protein